MELEGRWSEIVDGSISLFTNRIIFKYLHKIVCKMDEGIVSKSNKLFQFKNAIIGHQFFYPLSFT